MSIAYATQDDITALKRYVGGLHLIATGNGAGASASWGTISGSIGSQTDLQTSLNNLHIAAQVAPGTSGNVLTSNGSAWISAAPSGGGGGGSGNIDGGTASSVYGGTTSIDGGNA